MIVRINSIRKFGIYESYRWDSSMLDFQRYNLIFGWNYSGKTTFSRIFRCLELECLHHDFTTGKFEVELEDGTKQTETNLVNSVEIRVFNSDYIEDNIRWRGGLEPILILGEQNVRVQEELDVKKETHQSKLTEKRGLEERKVNLRSSIDGSLTDTARSIKNDLSLPDFDRRRLKRQVESIKDTYSTAILSDSEVTSLKEQIFAAEKKDPFSNINWRLQLRDNLFGEVNTTVTTVVIARTIERLTENRELQKWVGEGLKLQDGEELCAFCQQKIPDDFIEKLNGHFSDDYGNLKRVIVSLKRELEGLKNSIQGINFPADTAFYTHIKDGYKEQKEELEKKLNGVVEVLENAISNLTKKQENPFVTGDTQEYQVNTYAVNELLSGVNQLIDKNNERTREFDKQKEEAREKLTKHYTAQYIQEKNYFNLIEEEQVLERQIQELSPTIDVLVNEIGELEKQVSESAKGAEEINKVIRKYFGKRELEIQVTDDEKFVLKRSGEVAKNLSEGEKTVITFSYFIAKLIDKNTIKEDTIVFLDDPISSLDSNHLFNVYSIIQNELKDCKQVFISTHNFEFFNLLKDWVNGIKSYQRNQNTPVWSCYLIDRQKDGETELSKISQLPEILRKFKSEYHYLFSIIYDFHNTPSTDFEKLYLLPNIMRRYIEAFLGFKIPSYAGFKKKLPLFIPDEVEKDKVQKFIDQYSHNNSLPRSLAFPALDECKEVVRIVLDAVEKKDKEHYDILCDECSEAV
ncbi:AAA family ATPase [Saprospiraceae bacterium]|nr:AAA family ATPase [Saprospiraceae bacterium]